MKNVPVNPGDTVFAELLVTGTTTGTIIFQDLTTDQGTQFNTSWSGYTLQSEALWVLERTEKTYSGTEYLYPLADVGTIDVTDAEAEDSSGDTAPLGNFHRDYFYMYNCAGTELLASTGDMYDNGEAYPAIWDNFGPKELYNC